MTKTCVDLRHKTILVTGASDGIGKAAALAYAKAGAHIILMGRHKNLLSKVYDEILDMGASASMYPIDMGKAGALDYSQLAKILDENYTHLDGLLLNSAQVGELSPIEHHDIEQWFSVMQVNLNSQFMLVKALLGLLKASPTAKILFTLSPDKHLEAYWGAYGISKYALRALMHMLAQELEQTSITVQGINPGSVNSPFTKKAYPGLGDAHQLPLPEEIMPHYLTLMSTASTEHHGLVLDIAAERYHDPI